MTKKNTNRCKMNQKTQKAFIAGGDYQEGDFVNLQEKQYKITRIQGSVAHLIHRDGTGEATEQTMLLKDLPTKDMRVVADDSPADDDDPVVIDPTYEKGQKLANGWVVVRPSVKDKYMVRVNGSQQEMTGHMIFTAEKDYTDRMAALAEEKRIHQEAEAYAKQEMIEHYESQERVEKVSSVKREDDVKSQTPSKDKPVDKVEVLRDVLQKLEEVKHGVDRISQVRDELVSQMAELADRYDERIRKIEKAMAAQDAPMAARVDDPEVEVMTRVQHSSSAWDKELATLLNDGWRILNWSDLSDNKRMVALVRNRQDVIEVDDGEEIRVLEIPSQPRVVSGKIAITDVTEKYIGLSGSAALLAQRFDDEINANTRRIMGDEWYDRYGA
jgi:hypothetical protein